MTVGLYFLAALFTLWFAGYGLTGLLLSSASERRTFILVNGFCLAVAVFSESFFLFHAVQPALLTTIVLATILNVWFLMVRWRSRPDAAAKTVGHHAGRVLLARWAPWLLAIGIVAFVTWSFFASGWQSFWGTANEDMFDALNGRDAYLSGQAQEVGRFLDPLTRYQYSSLAFWSLLFRSFGGMNVFYLQGQLMLFMQVLGIYYLTRQALRLGHRAALLSSFVGTCGSFYISTFFTGHEGSLIFAAIIPFLLGLGLNMVHRRSLEPKKLLMIGLWLFVIFHTYVFPLGFSVIPFVLYALHRAATRDESWKIYLRGMVQKALALHADLSSRLIRFALMGLAIVFVAVVLVLAVDRIWLVLEPVRLRATTVFRAWGISHFKEMILIYWGFLPSSIPFGSIANPAKLDIPAVMIAGYFGAGVLMIGLLVALRSMIGKRNDHRMFLVHFAATWVAAFLFMKFAVLDSYYLYKFYYTNYYIGAILLVVAAGEVFKLGKSGGSVWTSRGVRSLAGFAAATFVLLNLAYITLYNIDVARRPYNQADSHLTNLTPIERYAQAGVYFNIPRFDLQNLLRYLFRHNGYPFPDAVAQFFEYELEVVGVDDVVLRQPGERSVVWENETYRLLRAKQSDKLRFDTYYQGEQYPYVYDNHPFRWVKDKFVLDIIDPAQAPHAIVFCVEPGPGLNYQPFWLYVSLDDALIDSVRVTGVQSVKVNLPSLPKRLNEIRVQTKENGRNFLPWEERHLNYRVALVGSAQRQFQPQTLRILNTPADVIPPRGWEIIATSPETFGDSSDVLLLGNNWSPVEYEDGRPLRWSHNDAQLLVFRKGPASRSLRAILEKGPALAGQSVTMKFLLNGTAIDSIGLEGRQEIVLRLPSTLPEESIIVLHVDRSGFPVGLDPRTLNFRILHARLANE
jgi:hypothetical protein